MNIKFIQFFATIRFLVTLNILYCKKNAKNVARLTPKVSSETSQRFKTVFSRWQRIPSQMPYWALNTSMCARTGNWHFNLTVT